MSFAEIGVVIIVALIVIKPDDLPVILKKIKEFYNYVISFKKQIEQELKNISEIDRLEEENSKINFYLQKIMMLDEKYEGDYSLTDVKAFYHKLILQKRINIKK